MAIHRFIPVAALAACMVLAISAWAGNLQFHGNDFGGQGTLSFTPGLGDSLTVTAGAGGNGALITDFFSSYGTCGGDCSVVGGYMTLSTGGQLACPAGGCAAGGAFNYSFGAGGNIKIVGEIPTLGINTPTVLFTASFLSGSFLGTGGVASVVAGINLASVALAPQLGLFTFYSGSDNDDIAFNVSPTCSSGGVCSGMIIESDTSFQTIPEPSALSVLGGGLFIFAAGLRRRIATDSARCVRSPVRHA